MPTSHQQFNTCNVYAHLIAAEQKKEDQLAFLCSQDSINSSHLLPLLFPCYQGIQRLKKY